MKKVFLAGLSLLSTMTYAQKMDASKVPQPVKTAFSKSFAGVNDAKWENEKGNYEANFSKDGKKMAVLFDGSGKLMETETSIAIKELPANVTAYMSKNYKDQKVKEAAKIILADGSMQYEAAIKGMDVLFDKSGNFIKTAKD